MENLSSIAKLLGEDNEKRLKDTITDMLIDHLDEDLRNMCVYLIDFEKMFDEISEDVEREVRDIVVKRYMEKANKKLEKLFKEME